MLHNGLGKSLQENLDQRKIILFDIPVSSKQIPSIIARLRIPKFERDTSEVITIKHPK